MDYGELCGLHFDSASIVKVNDKKSFVYDAINKHFVTLTSCVDAVGNNVLDINTAAQSGYNSTVYQSNLSIINRIVDSVSLNSVHNVNDQLIVQQSIKQPIKHGKKIIGIYTASVDKTKEISLPCLYKHYLDFFSDKQKATRNFLRHLSIDHLFYRVPSVAEIKNYLLIGSCHLTIKEIAKISGKSSATLNTQLQSFKKCLKSEFAHDNIAIFKPFLKSFEHI